MKMIYNKLINTCLGFVGAYCAYPLAEIYEKRKIHSKVKELKNFYKLDFNERKTISVAKLIETLEFVKLNVPYYKDVFNKIQFDPEVLNKDIQYFNEIPYLTKDIIREQGERLLSTPLESIRHYRMKTGGSTGPSTVIYYDQAGADYSAAITRYARQTIGDLPYKSELHFAASFARPPKHFFPTKDDLKHFSLNRTNIFFDRLDDFGLEEMWQILMERKPFLIHGHPSTLYALACYVKNTYGEVRVFNVFESSGELLQPYMREMISDVFNCKVVDRYGLAEFGVIGYEIGGYENGCQLLESEGWPEHRKSNDGNELVFTGFRNRLMPLIRYATGDMGKVVENHDGYFLTNVVGRIHDMVNINGVDYPTHHIMDVLDHRVGGIQEFQIDVREDKPILRIALEPFACEEETTVKINSHWREQFIINYVHLNDFIKVGRHSKFRHVVFSRVKTRRIFFDISSIPDITLNLTGISRLIVSMMDELVRYYPDICICGISFRSEFDGYRTYSLNEIQNLSAGHLDNFSKTVRKIEEIVLEKDDIIILLGEQWLFKECIPQLKELRNQRGVKVVSFIYDLVPFFMPELYWDNFPEIYQKCINDLVDISDLLFVISENTKNDLIKFCPQIKKNQNIERIRLGENLPTIEGDYDLENFILCVGTIQPRKNHLLLLMVWRRLILEKGDLCPTLVLVGKIGWHVDELIYFLKETPLLNSKVKIIEDADDNELGALYSKCKFSVYPSIYEGWGLPIRESLSYGKFCIASNSSSMIEAGGKFCEYFSPYDSGELYKLIVKYFNNERCLAIKEDQIKKEYIPVTWKDSMEQFMSVINKIG